MPLRDLSPQQSPEAVKSRSTITSRLTDKPGYHSKCSRKTATTVLRKEKDRKPKTSNAPIFSAITGIRYYSAELGRWVSRDPIGEWGGVNLYVHCLNSSLLVVDVLGMKTLPWERDCCTELEIGEFDMPTDDDPSTIFVINPDGWRRGVRGDFKWFFGIFKALCLPGPGEVRTITPDVENRILIGWDVTRQRMATFECYYCYDTVSLERIVVKDTCKKKEGTEYWKETGREPRYVCPQLWRADVYESESGDVENGSVGVGVRKS